MLKSPTLANFILQKKKKNLKNPFRGNSGLLYSFDLNFLNEK